MDENTLKSKIKLERKIISYFFYPLFILHWLSYEIPWRISSRSRLKMKQIKRIEDLEMGRVYYVRKTPFNTSGFNVYFERNEEWDTEYNLDQADLSDSTLKGKTNYHFISVKEAREKGYSFELDLIKIDDNYGIKENINIPDFNFDIKKESIWIRENIPEEYQIINANCGKDRFSPNFDGITSKNYMKMLIEDRRCVYKLIDSRMLSQLDSYGMYDSLEKWEESFNA